MVYSGYEPAMDAEILEKTADTWVPRIVRMAMTTTAIKTRINAYSTIPWPFSFGENNMIFHLLPLYKFLAPLPDLVLL
jgi:hypothetical protein